MTRFGYARQARACASLAFLFCALTVPLRAQSAGGGQAAPSPDPPTFSETVVVTTPLPGVEVPAAQVPAPVQTASGADVERSGALAISDFVSRRLNAVHINEIQGNPFQPDVNYRGFTASPLLGTPQGLSVYLDGVRLNQPFGDVVSWDVIPRVALGEATLMPGSNPVFGLNTLGGALSLQTKSGLNTSGTMVQATYGSNLRRLLEFDHGGRKSGGPFHWYVAGSLFGEDGWRVSSPSRVAQLFGKVGRETPGSALTLSLGVANNELTGNGLQDTRLLDRDYSSIYTKPDTTDNTSSLLTVTSRQQLRPSLSLHTVAHYRGMRTATLNGDVNEDSLDQSVYQPNAAERAALAAAGYGQIPASGLDATNTPFPSLRCIGNALLRDEPAEKCNGLLNRTRTSQSSGGVSTQLVHRGTVAKAEHVFLAGGAFDRSTVRFTQTAELGFLNPDRSVTGVGAFGDGVTGGDVDGVPFDARISLDGHVTTWSAFAADTVSLGGRTHVTLSGRYNRVGVVNRDAINPGGGSGSLDGDHVFSRFNPAAGVTVDVSRRVNLYAGYNEGSRAATSVELGCADPESPCKLPNAMAGDPPLRQVVTRTVEGGARGDVGSWSWNAGTFRAVNQDDILFVLSDRTGFGYFRNFGETRRQGLELGLRGAVAGTTLGMGYTMLDATFQSAEIVNGESNSTSGSAEIDDEEVEEAIAITPGDRLPLVPRHILKVFGSVRVTSRLAVSADMQAVAGSFARGNENNRHEPDGEQFLGEGRADRYAVVNLGAEFRLTSALRLVAQVNNLLDRRYATAAQLGPAAFSTAGTFVARPMPAINGEFPLCYTTFSAPGAPARGWVGIRASF